MINQYEITLKPRAKGNYLITDEILSSIKNLPEKGLMNIFIKHTSAALTINENCDADVRADLEKSLDHLVKENEPFYLHTAEGADDMPAHIKASLMGSSLTIPIQNQKLGLGTWQGIYLTEFRRQTHQRKIVITIYS